VPRQISSKNLRFFDRALGVWMFQWHSQNEFFT